MVNFRTHLTACGLPATRWRRSLHLKGWLPNTNISSLIILLFLLLSLRFSERYARDMRSVQELVALISYKNDSEGTLPTKLKEAHQSDPIFKKKPNEES